MESLAAIGYPTRETMTGRPPDFTYESRSMSKNPYAALRVVIQRGAEHGLFRHASLDDRVLYAETGASHGRCR